MEQAVSLFYLFHQRTFEVPDYRRGYSWENQQVEVFLEILVNNSGNNK